MSGEAGSGAGGAVTGGELIADVLVARGVRFLFTLCGGHISPILVAAKARGIAVIDVRHEASAAFAADAISRLTGTAGVAVVTAGPGVTNTVTAIKNAQLAQSAVVLLGGATGTVLKGRGSLQDIDQLALMEPHVKWMASCEKVRELVPALEQAFEEARHGVPGPVFVECPVDLLYDESLVRGIYGVGPSAAGRSPRRSLSQIGIDLYLRWHLHRLFKGGGSVEPAEPVRFRPLEAEGAALRKVATALGHAKRPLLLVGSQAVLHARDVHGVANAVDLLGVPAYLSGMARGLLGPDHPRHFRHRRREALREADVIVLAGVAADFRLDYGRHLPRRAKVVSVNLSDHDLTKNRRPQIGILADPGRFLQALASELEGGSSWEEWKQDLRHRDQERDAEIVAMAEVETSGINPVALCRAIDRALDDDSVLVADGGDFVATASYTVRPRGPLRWLDPGVFGTLGVGGGFAVAAKAARPDSEVWLLWGDGSAAYSLAEFDTLVRHGLPVIAVVGNDASWQQIAREQVELLGDDVGVTLRHSDYHRVAEGYGGKGLRVDRIEDVPAVLAEAKRLAAAGHPVLVNAILGKTDFRKGSISM